MLTSTSHHPSLAGLLAVVDDPMLSQALAHRVDKRGLVAELTDPDVLRHVPGRRATLRAVAGDEVRIVKLFTSPRARGNHRRLLALAAAGLSDLVPVSHGATAKGHVGVLSFRQGEVLESVPDQTFVAGCGASGRALRRLHDSAADLDRAWTHHDEVAQLLRRMPSSGLAHAQRVACYPVTDVELVPSHRDFHPRQVVVATDPASDHGARAAEVRIAFIDLDDAAMAPAGLDVGNMVAHLHREAITGRRTPPTVAAAVNAFLSGYGEQPADLEAWVHLTLARLAGLAESRHERLDERDALLALLDSLQGPPPPAPRLGSLGADALTGVAAGAAAAARPDVPSSGVAPAGTTGPITTGPITTGPITTGPINTGPISTGPITTGHADRPVRTELTADGQPVVVKSYLSADGYAIFTLMDDLWHSPFGRERLPGPGMPEPLSFDARRGELTMRFAAGEPLAVRGELGGSLARAGEAAQLLVDLHGSEVVTPRRRDLARLVRSAARKVRDRADSEVAADYRATLAAIETAVIGLPHHGDADLVPSHGDFSPRNLLATPAGLVLIDFDRAQQASRWRDVAYWDAWCWVTATSSPAQDADNGSATGWAAGAPFVQAYQQLTRLQPTREEFAVHRALSLVRIAHGWSSLQRDPTAVERVLAEARRQLTAG